MLEFTLTGSDYLECPNQSISNNLTSISVACWIYLRSISSDKRIIGKYTGSTGWLMFANQGTPPDHQDLIWNVYYSATGRWRTPENSILTNTWYHVGISHTMSDSGTDPLMYINGVSQTVVETNVPSGAYSGDSGNNIRIGASTGAPPTSGFWDGYLKDLRVFNRVITADEMANLAAGYSGPLGGEVFWMPMNIIAGVAHPDGTTLSASNLVYDLTGNGHDGTPTTAGSGYPKAWADERPTLWQPGMGMRMK